MTQTAVTIGEVRFSYCNLFRAVSKSGKPEDAKYSTTVLIPKTNVQAKAIIDAAVNAALEAGVSKCWSGVRPPQPAICVHDGDGPRPSDGQPFGEECRGMWVFTASSKQAPFVVDANVQPILNQADVYSGMYGRVNVNFFAYINSGKKGIGCGLNGVQKLRDGEPLSAHVSAEEAFGAPAVAPVAPAYPQPAAQQQAAYYPPQPQAPGYPPQQQAYSSPAYQQPTYSAPAYQAQPAAPAQAPGYPPQQAAAPGGYRVDPQQAAAPGGYRVDPTTGQPLPNGMSVMGM